MFKIDIYPVVVPAPRQFSRRKPPAGILLPERGEAEGDVVAQHEIHRVTPHPGPANKVTGPGDKCVGEMPSRSE